MVDDWSPTKLGAEVDLLTGFPFKSECYTDSADGIRLLRGDNIVQGSLRWDGVKKWPVSGVTGLEKYQLQYRDVVMAMDRPWIEAGLKYAAIFKADLPCLLVQRTARLRGGTRLDTEFLRYVIGSREFTQHILAVQTGTAVPHISSQQIKDFSFLLPPLTEQRAIASVLGTLDDLIELNRETNEILEEMARALFKSWFVDFDPVRAKLEGRQPTGMDAATATLFPDHFQDSELGQIPRGWELKPLGDLAVIDKGLSYKGSGLADEGGTPMVNLGCFSGRGIFNPDKIKRYTGEYRERHLVHEGDLVIANTDMTQNRVIIGSPSIVPRLGKETKFIFTHHVFAVRFKPGMEIFRRYVYFTLLKPEFREIAEGFSTGTTVLALPRDGLTKYMLCIPPATLIEKFERQAEPLLAIIHANNEESRDLATLRDTLLPKLLSGDVRAPAAKEVAHE